jgi:AraC-like DNA-binding protein
VAQRLNNAAGESHDFRKFRFQTPAITDRNWIDWYREEFSRQMFGVEVVPGADRQLWVDATTRVLPKLSFYSGRASPMRSTASTAALEGIIGVTIALAGRMSVHVDGEPVELTPGAAVFGTAGVLETYSDTSLFSVGLSPRLLAPLVPNIADLTQVVVPAEHPALGLLTGYLQMLDAQQTIASPEAADVVATHVHDLVGLALGATRDGAALAAGSVRAARLAAVKRDIHLNLDDPGLGIAALAARHALSPRYIHKLFEAEGASFTEYVLQHRLRRAHRMLLDPRFNGMPIGTIALTVGFGDLSYFNRTFRRRFGGTPTDIRRAIS